jgi:ribosome-associated translation inhibitor RaiA
MKISYKFTDTEPDVTLQAYAQSKVLAFEKLLSKKDADAAICDVEFRRSTKHQTGDVCTAEVNLEVEGELYRVTKDEPSFEKAIDKVKDDILNSLRDNKEKHRKLQKKGGRMLKKMIQHNEKSA